GPTMHAIYDWFDRHVAGSPHPFVDPFDSDAQEPRWDEQSLSVFHGQPPQPNRLHLLPELISPRGGVSLPRSDQDWEATRRGAVERLRAEVFPLIEEVESPQTLALTVDAVSPEGSHYRQWQGA